MENNNSNNNNDFAELQKKYNELNDRFIKLNNEMADIFTGKKIISVAEKKDDKPKTNEELNMEIFNTMREYINSKNRGE